LELPSNSRILDIACGNGAIGTLAAETGRKKNKDFFVAATDLAVINNKLIGDENDRELRSTIQFHSRTPCEAQPFDDDSFDLVTSQFGFEYSDIRKTLSEVRRLLRPDGRFVAIAHHRDSVLIQAAKVELDIYALAMDELGLLDAAGRYFDALGEINGNPGQLKDTLKKTKPLSLELNGKMDRFRKAYPSHECSLFIAGTISFIARSVKQTTADERRAAVKQAMSDFQLARARLDDMVAAALSDEQIEMFAIDAREAGFPSTHCLNLYGDDEGLAGWQIHLR